MSDEFIIHRGVVVEKDEILDKIVRIRKSIKHPKVAIDLINQLRFEYNYDMDCDYKLNTIKMHLIQNKIVEAHKLLDIIRNDMFKKYSGQKLIENRIKNNKDIGDLNEIPYDLLAIKLF